MGMRFGVQSMNRECTSKAQCRRVSPDEYYELMVEIIELGTNID